MRSLLILFASLVLLHSAHAQDVYSVEGETKGFFCRFLGFVCSFKKVDALKVGKEEIRALPRSYDNISDYKPSPDEAPGRCWITTRSDSSWGWYTYLIDWWKEAPVFFAAKDDGTYEELGSPDFIVFRCRKYS